LLRDEQATFSSEQINAMLLTELKQTCETSTKTPMADVVASVPGYWTSRQRKALVDSGKIAGTFSFFFLSRGSFRIKMISR